MRTQECGKKPDINLSWFLKTDYYVKEKGYIALDTEEGKKQLSDAILLCISQNDEIRIGTDGCCLILEAYYSDGEGSFQWVDDDHYVAEYNQDACTQNIEDLEDTENSKTTI